MVLTREEDAVFEAVWKVGEGLGAALAEMVKARSLKPSEVDSFANTMGATLAKSMKAQFREAMFGTTASAPKVVEEEYVDISSSDATGQTVEEEPEMPEPTQVAPPRRVAVPSRANLISLPPQPQKAATPPLFSREDAVKALDALIKPEPPPTAVNPNSVSIPIVSTATATATDPSKPSVSNTYTLRGDEQVSYNEDLTPPVRERTPVVLEITKVSKREPSKLPEEPPAEAEDEEEEEDEEEDEEEEEEPVKPAKKPPEMILCPTCGKECKGKAGLRGHMRFQHAVPSDATVEDMAPATTTPVAAEPLICSICGKTGFANQGGLRGHILFAHKQTAPTEPVSRMAGLVIERTTAPLVEETPPVKASEEPRFKCYHCGRCFQDAPSLSKHRGNKHKGLETPLEERTCKTCGQVFEDRRKLGQHVRNTHPLNISVTNEDKEPVTIAPEPKRPDKSAPLVRLEKGGLSATPIADIDMEDEEVEETVMLKAEPKPAGKTLGQAMSEPLAVKRAKAVRGVFKCPKCKKVCEYQAHLNRHKLLVHGLDENDKFVGIPERKNKDDDDD